MNVIAPRHTFFVMPSVASFNDVGPTNSYNSISPRLCRGGTWV